VRPKQAGPAVPARVPKAGRDSPPVPLRKPSNHGSDGNKPGKAAYKSQIDIEMPENDPMFGGK